MSSSRLSHIAFLVSSVDRSAAHLAARGFPIAAAEIWEGEGTREIYVGDPVLSGRVLLMEPIREGAYSRAMLKRGPGLHHIGIDVIDLEVYIAGLSGSGWLLHPRSVETIQKSRTAWLARPGVPTLIEVHGRDELPSEPDFVSGFNLPIPPLFQAMFTALGLGDLFTHEGPSLSFTANGSRVNFNDWK